MPQQPRMRPANFQPDRIRDVSQAICYTDVIPWAFLKLTGSVSLPSQ